MSVETLPSSHWIQSDENGGRIIGEVCHIIQLFFHLTQARVQAISVETAHAGLTPHFSRDNFVVNLRFDDGSLCTLLYTTLGHASLGKERAEIHTSGVSIVLDDYRTLKGFGTPWGFAEKVYRANKGHHALLTTFIDALRKPSGTLPLSLNHLLDVTYTTLMIDHLAAQQGGDLTMESKNYMSHSHKEIQI
jgi:predicted dehydrogenase